MTFKAVFALVDSIFYGTLHATLLQLNRLLYLHCQIVFSFLDFLVDTALDLLDRVSYFYINLLSCLFICILYGFANLFVDLSVGLSDQRIKSVHQASLLVNESLLNISDLSAE